MIIVGFGLAFIAASVFFAWVGVQHLRTSWREKKARRSRVQYYKHQYPQAAEMTPACASVLSFVRNWRHRRRVMSKTVKKIDPELDARKSGSFKIGGVIDVHRLGFGAMRITGRHLGPPADRAEAVAHPETRARARHQFHRHGRFLRAGCLRGADPRSAPSLRRPSDRHQGRADAPGPDVWEPNGAPRYLRDRRQEPEAARRRADRALATAPHRSESAAPSSSSAPSRRCIDDGIIRHAGLERSLGRRYQGRAEDCFRSRRCRTSTTSSSAAAKTCSTIARRRASASSRGTRSPPAISPAGLGARHDRQAHKRDASQIALAWVLKRSPVMLPIPGTSKVAHLEENVAAVTSSSATTNSPRSTLPARKPRKQLNAPHRFFVRYRFAA